MNGHLMLNHRTLASYNLVTNSEIVVGRTNVSVDAAGRAQAQRRWVRVMSVYSVPNRALWV